MKTYNITKLFLTLCTCVCATLAMAQVNESDRQELVNFYNNSCKVGCTFTWNLDEPVSTWDGITLNDDGTTIKYIDLSGKGLTGSIPDFNLPQLVALWLDNNDLSGSLPDFNGLSGLQHISIKHNDLSGEIPNFSNLPELTWLELERNELSGIIPNFNQLPKLKALLLPKNDLTGTIPKFDNLPNLEKLSLFDNQLTGAIPDFSHLSKLHLIGLMDNALSGTIPNLDNLLDLAYIFLSDNELTGNIPNINHLTKLVHFNLSDNALSDTIPDVTNLSKLDYFSVANNELTGSIPDFAGCNTLTQLYVNDNELSGTVPDLSQISLLEKFHIQHNQFTHTDIETYFDENNNTIESEFEYSPQYYGNPQFHTKPEGDPLTISPKPSIPNDNPSVRWMKNGYYLTDYQVNDTTYIFPSMGMSDIGIYRYFFKDETLTPLIEFQSQPIYVRIEGYDLSGAPVIPRQLILDYGVNRPISEISDIRDDLITNHGGTILNSCGCSVEVDLWEFPDDTAMDMVRENLGIDGGSEKRTTTADIDGGSEKRTTTADIDGGQNTNTNQWLLHAPNNGEQIAVNFVSSLGEGSVVIGVLDTGLDTAHPDITDNVWNNPDDTDQNCYINDTHGYDFVNNNESINDDHGHGTHVGGVIAANVPEGIDIKVMPIKTFDNQGKGTMYRMLCGIYYAIDNGADIINISGGYAGYKSSLLQKTIQYGRENDVLFVVSAGNESIDLDKDEYWPASFSKDEVLSNTMITVTSIDATYNLSGNVGYGDTTVTVAAQGEGVFSPMMGGGYAHFTGTSISTPLVALALGIEKTQNPDRNYTTLRSDFLNSLDTQSKLTPYVEKGRVLTVGINNLNTIIINPKDQCIGTAADTTSFGIYSDIDFEVSTDANWLSLSDESGNDDIRLEIDYQANTSADSRSATILVTGGGRTYRGYLIQEGTKADPTDLTINKPYINSEIIFKTASNTITATGLIENGAEVHYYAGGSIVMNAGFHAQPGSYFLASISGCEQPDNKEEQLIPQISLRSYPNPFSTQTTIEYSLSEDSDITLIISDVAGRQIAMPINHETKTAGTHKVIFDGSQLPSGMYYYTIKTGDYFGTQKMILAK